MTGQQEAYLQKFWNEIQQAGSVLRNQEPPRLTDDAFFLYEKTGNRLIYENAYFTRRKYLTVFGILSEFGKKESDIEALNQIIISICKERFWALPAHVDFSHLDEKTIDLFAAETAQSLAEILLITGDRLPRETVALAQAEIMDRVLTPFCTSAFPYGWWETDRCNWSAVCAGSIGIAAIAMDRMGRLPSAWKDSCIKRVCNALSCYLEGMENDGTCTEGLGYFSYGMSYFTAFAELLYQETDGTVNLMANPKCGKIAAFQEKCYFGNGLSLSFSDADCHEHFLPGLTAYLVHCFPDTGTPDYASARTFGDDSCCRWLPNERNIRWLVKYGACVHKKNDNGSCALLPCAQWMIYKNQDGNGFAAKGGHNDENHNHNDVGHFLCAWQGELLLTDLGAGEYTKDYFHEGRYQILCNRSLGHSVPLINGCEQCTGSAFRADQFLWDEEKEMLTISFANAYPEGCIDRLTRTIAKEQAEDMALSVTDCFIPSGQTMKITENLITPFLPKITHDDNVPKILITGKRGACTITCNALWHCPEQIQILPKEHFLHDGTKTTVYLIQWDLPIENHQKTECCIRLCFSNG